MSTKLFTIQQVADQLGVSTKTLRRWEAKGLISAQRTLGNQRRYTQEDINLLRDKTKKPAPSSNTSKQGETYIPSYYEAASDFTVEPEPQTISYDAISTGPFGLHQGKHEEPKDPIIGAHRLASDFKIPTIMPSMKLKTALMLGLFVAMGLSGVVVAGLGYLGKQTAGSITPPSLASEVLAESMQFQGFEGEISFNIPAEFTQKVTINSDLLVDGNATVSGTLTAPNILYSLIAGNNISITGDVQNPTISADIEAVSSF
jgi:excisionase family DNA binding protein